MRRLRVNPGLEPLLRRHRLDDYTGIMKNSAGSTIESASERDTRLLELDGQHFFLKRVRAEKMSSAVESYLRGRLAHSKPWKEMLHYEFLRAAGFDVADVVAVGEELNWGFPVAGFILTRKVDGRELSELYRQSGSRDRRRLAGRFGALVGKLHSAGFFGSIRLKDIICNGPPGTSMTMTLIDREVRNPYPKRPNRQGLLYRLRLNLRRQISQGECFSEREWNLFCRCYCAQLAPSLGIRRAFLMAEIRQLQRRVLPRG